MERFFNYYLQMKTLFTIYFRQLWRNFQKGSLFGKVYLLGCLWMVEGGACFAILSDDTVSLVFRRLSPLFVAVIPMVFLLPDIIYRFFMTHEETAMDAFLRTRPVKEDVWDQFLWLSQFLHPENLILPALIIPIALIAMPIGWGLALLLSLYLVSVFDAIVVMEMRRGSPYAENKKQQVKAGEGWLERLLNRFGLTAGQSAIFGLQLRSLLRSRRIQLPIIFFVIYFAWFSYSQGFTPVERGDNIVFNYFLFFALLLPSNMLSQYGFGIEANYFNGLWSRPLPLRRILDDKFRIYNVLTLLSSLVYLPACFMGMLSWFVLIGQVLFTIGVGNIYTLWPCFHCEPFDLMGKAFFNQQGSRSSFNAKTFGIIFALIGLNVPFAIFLEPMWFCLYCLVLSIIGLSLRRKFFDYLIRDFERKKYKYMERYQK